MNEKPSVLFDNGLNRSERIRTGTDAIEGLDPNKHYVLIRKDNPQEIEKFASMGYEPARGDERYASTAFDDLLGNKNVKGSLKVKGNRLLVHIDKKIYDARQKEKLDARHKTARKSSAAEALEIQRTHPGSVVEPLGEDEKL